MLESIQGELLRDRGVYESLVTYNTKIRSLRVVVLLMLIEMAEERVPLGDIFSSINEADGSSKFSAPR